MGFLLGISGRARRPWSAAVIRLAAASQTHGPRADPVAPVTEEPAQDGRRVPGHATQAGADADCWPVAGVEGSDLTVALAFGFCSAKRLNAGRSTASMSRRTSSRLSACTSTVGAGSGSRINFVWTAVIGSPEGMPGYPPQSFQKAEVSKAVFWGSLQRRPNRS